MEITQEYSDLCQKLWEMRNLFYRQYIMEPNIVYLGYDEMMLLKSGAQFVNENGIKMDRELWTVWGMELKEVCQTSYLAVGFVLK